jgi:hypothetical protein
VILGDVSDTALDEPLDQGAHLAHMVRRARFMGWFQATERGDVLLILGERPGGHLGDGLVERETGEVAHGAGVDLVVDVGDVARIDHVRLAVDLTQQAEQQVEHDGRAAVADVRVIVDGRPTGVETHMHGVDGREGSLRARQRVVERQLNRHGFPQSGARGGLGPSSSR